MKSMKGKKVSIIVPIYKVEAYLEECLEALIHQTYKKLEIILIDDASPDRCPHICDEYAHRDPRIKVIHKNNGGAGSARNAGLDCYSGEYVCFVDSDDYPTLDYVEKLVKALEEKKADMAASGYSCLYRDIQTPGEILVLPGEYTSAEYLRQFLKDWNCGLLWNKIFKKEVLAGLRFEEGRRIDDEFFTYQAVIQAKKIVQIEDKLYKYRMRASGVMKSGAAYSQKMLEDQLAYLTIRYDTVSKAYPELKKEYLENLMDNLIQLNRKSGQYPTLEKKVRKKIRELLGTMIFGPASVKAKYIFIRNIWFIKKEIDAGKEEAEKGELFK